MKVIIVGTGPSARGFVPPDGVTIIAVKGAVYSLPRADYWFSLDPNAVGCRDQMMYQLPTPGCKYYCACEPRDILPPHVERLVRVSNRSRSEPRPRGTPRWWLWRWSAALGLSKSPGYIHTGNSAYGALGLAYQLGFRDVLLVGVDGTQDQRTNGGRPKNLSHLPLLFQSALPQIKLATVGTMDGIPTKTLQRWCEQ